MNHTNFFLVLRVSVCHRPDLWQLLQQQYYAYSTSCTFFRIIVSNVPGQLQENGMMLLELKQSCANSLCIHISGKCIDPTMDNDYFRNIFIEYLNLQIRKSSDICIIYCAKVSDLLHCLPPLAIKTLKANLTCLVTELTVHVLQIPSKGYVWKC